MFAMRALLVLLLCGLPLTSQELFPGVSREFRIDPIFQPTLLGNLTVQVPAGTQWVIVTSLTDGPDQDVDLYVRFGRPVEMAANGEVLADFRSESPAGPDEHVFINPSTAPPLQNGFYFVAWVVRSLEVEVRLTVRAVVTRGGAETTRVISTFDNGNDEGWRRNFPPSSIEGSSTGDSGAAIAVDPEGFLRITEPDGPARDYAVAPPKFLGNLAGFSDPYFEFELRYFEGADPTFPIEIRLIGAGTAYRFLGEIPEPGKWTRVHAPLSAGSWRRVEGVAPFQTVLQNVQRIEVSMDHAPGPETNDLDSFRFNGGPLPPPSGPGGPDFSDFETGVDGWTRNFPASAIPFASFGSENAAVLHGLGGNQSEGFLLLVDGGERNRDFAVAPDKFIRGLADLDRPWYEFEYRRFEGEFPFFSVRLRLLGNGAVYEWSGIRPRQMWDRYRVPIDDRNWVHVEGPRDFNAMLRNVQRLELSMDHALGFEVNGLDNFRLRTQYTPPVGPAIQLDRESIEVSIASPDDLAVLENLRITATGAEVEWRGRVEPAGSTWLGLTRTSGSTPDRTEIIVDPAGLGPGVHRAELAFTATLFGVPERRVAVTLVIGADPRVPVLSQGGAIQAADPALPLSPGALGSLFGVFLAPKTLIPALSGDRLPTSALGVEVRVTGPDGSLLGLAPLLYLSPGQLNFQMPYEAAGLTAATLRVVRDGWSSNPQTVSLTDAAPGIFPAIGEAAAVVNPDGSINAPESPAEPGSILTAYFTGAGVVQPPVASGRTAPLEPLSFPAGPLRAEMIVAPAGAVSAEVIGAALSPGFVGLAQLSLRLPAGLQPGRHTLRLTVADRRSNSVSIWVR